MADTYTYPTQKELKEIEQVKLPVLTEDDEVFTEFPIVETNSWRLTWEQLDNYTGLQAVRGLNGQPGHVKMIGAKSYDFEPGVYGDFTTFGEKQLTEQRELGSFDEPISLDTLVGRAQTMLLNRRLDRIRYIIWTLLTTGTFAISREDGAILHTDVFPLKTYSAAASWSSPGTATPFADIRGMKLIARGQSVSFGAGAKLYINQVTANQLLVNTNSADAYGKRTNYGATLNSLEDINAINKANDLPEIVVYDTGYLDDNGTFQPFIPNGTGVLIGKRTNGARLGEYRMTRNANNPRLEAGPYTRVVDHGEHTIPRRIDVHDGHNGGPVIYFPGAVVVFTC
jgi:hypothetical protein